MSSRIVLPEPVESAMPYRGRCGLCGGPDARHRVLDSIADCVNSTDEHTTGGADDAAEEFGYPVEVCQYIGDHWDGETQMWRLDA